MLPDNGPSSIERAYRRRPPHSIAEAGNGHVAEWLRNGLQNRVPQFNSGRGLQYNQQLKGFPLFTPMQRAVPRRRHGPAARAHPIPDT
jgi:hypothetical protein